MPGEVDDLPDDLLDPAPAAPTAKTLSARAIFDEPHSGHSAFASASLIERMRSNLASHA
jgi:hypothetical protein